MNKPENNKTNITGDIYRDAYTGNIDHAGDRHTEAQTYVEGDQINYYYGPAAQRHIPDQSPRRVAHFVDRTTELADLVANAHPGRIITLTGPGGMGKTALVAEAIHCLYEDSVLLARFPDGILFHDFYVEPAADQALSHIARTYNEPIDREGIQSAARRALSNRTALLLLDGTENCDRLDRVTAVAGHCGIIITTRRRSDASTTATNLPPLPEKDAVRLIAQWAHITPTEPAIPSQLIGIGSETKKATLPHIASLVGYLPLALRLVGRYLAQKHEDPANYLEWLQETPLEALGDGKQRREESVPYLIERSLRVIDEDAREFLAVTGVLAFAPFDCAVIAMALDLPENRVRHPLDQLIDYGLILQSDDGNHNLAHALVHTYARQRLSPPLQILRRLIDYYKMVFKTETSNGASGLALLDPHRAHILALAEHCATRSIWPSVRQLAWAARSYFDLAGYWTDRIVLLQLGISASRNDSAPYDEAAFLNSLGIAYASLGQEENAIHYCKQALTLSRHIGDRRTEGNHLGNLGLVFAAAGQLEQAIDYYQQALTIAQELGDKRGEGAHLGNLGNAYASLSQVEKAIDYHRQAIAIAQSLGDKRGESNRLGSLGIAYRNLGQLEQAIGYYQQALEIAQYIGDKRGEGAHLGNLGNAYAALGQMEDAIEYYVQAVAIAQQIGDKRNESNHLGNLGIAYDVIAQANEAINCHQKAINIAQYMGDRRSESNHLGNLGVAYANLGNIEEAIKYYEQALTIAQQIGDKRSEGNQLGNLGLAHATLRNTEKAVFYYERAITNAQLTDRKRSEADHLSNMGNTYYSIGKLEEAISCYQQALKAVQVIGDKRREGNLLRTLGLAHADLGRVEQSMVYYQEAVVVAQHIGDKRGEGNLLASLGTAYQKQGNLGQARHTWQQALGIFESLKSPNADILRRRLSELDDNTP